MCIFSTVIIQLIQTLLRPLPRVSESEQKMVFLSNHVQVVCLGTLGFKNKFSCDGHGRRSLVPLYDAVLMAWLIWIASGSKRVEIR
jgi:hypothetical protein